MVSCRYEVATVLGQADHIRGVIQIPPRGPIEDGTSEYRAVRKLEYAADQKLAVEDAERCDPGTAVFFAAHHVIRIGHSTPGAAVPLHHTDPDARCNEMILENSQVLGKIKIPDVA